MKKTIVLLLTFALCIVMALGIYASDYSVSPYRNMIQNYDAAYIAMYTAVSEHDDSVDLTEYKISTGDIIKIYSDLCQNSPEFFYLDKEIRYYYNNTGLLHYVTKLNFNYTMSDEEIAEATTVYENEISYIVSQVDIGLSDAEKALWVHDYFVASFAYDNDESIYDAYGLFKERKGVCQAYSLAYVAVMRELGIKCYMVTSLEMNHAWNIVNIDGSWYHIDLVFDDPSPDRTGRVMHDYFLLSDTAMKQADIPHFGWQSRYTCDSDAYANGIWTKTKERMLYDGGRWYYINDETLYLESLRYSEPENVNMVFGIDEKWYVDDDRTRYWIGAFSGVSDFLGYIFVNTPTEIIAYNTSTGRVTVFYEVKDGETLFGSNIYKNTIEYYIATSPEAQDGYIEQFEMKDFDYGYTKKEFPFEDVSKLDKEYSAIKYVYNRGLFKGVSATKFAPDSSLTRAMFVTALGRLCGVNESEYTTLSFSDVKSGYWYSSFIEWANSVGIANGVGGGRFAPIETLTREQMYKMAAECGRAFGFGEEADENTTLDFSDSSDVSDWAVDGIRFCIKNNLIEDVNADMIFAPKSPSTRGEAAVLVYKLASMVSTT